MTEISELHAYLLSILGEEQIADTEDHEYSAQMARERLAVEGEILGAMPICLEDCALMLDTILDTHDFEHGASAAIRTVADFLRVFQKAALKS